MNARIYLEIRAFNHFNARSFDYGEYASAQDDTLDNTHDPSYHRRL
jgi:hypothetical protein